MKCDLCGIEDMMPYTCSYCRKCFCSAHRIPENHGCKCVERGKKVKKQRPVAKARGKSTTFTYNNEDDFID